MKHRALIVEDDADIAESVTDTLDSLGHQHEWVKSQEEARPKISAGGFTYVLLDLQIPMRFGRGLACIEYGEHLAREIHQSPAMQGVPIVVMTAYGKEGLEIAAPLCEHGVVDFINKPFPRNGRTLASVISLAIDRAYRSRERARSKNLKPEKPFQVGEMVFHHDRIELCGVTVVSSGRSGQMWAILNALSHRLDDRRYRAMPGSTLVDLVDGNGGQGSIAGSIRDFRRHVSEVLGTELGLEVNMDDVIETSNAGYRLSARIVVKDMRKPGTADAEQKRASFAGIGREDAASDRRERILQELRAGERLRLPALAQRLHCSQSTIKRDIEAMKADGKIEFIGPTKTGHYKTVEKRVMATNGDKPQ
jgi:CheY-like chemotaxis protein